MRPLPPSSAPSWLRSLPPAARSPCPGRSTAGRPSTRRRPSGSWRSRREPARAPATSSAASCALNRTWRRTRQSPGSTSPGRSRRPGPPARRSSSIPTSPRCTSRRPQVGVTPSPPRSRPPSTRRLFAAAPRARSASLVVTLSQVFGQWRIANVENPQVLWAHQLRHRAGLRPGAALLRRARVPGPGPGPAVVPADLRARHGHRPGQLAAPPAYLRSAVVTGIPINTRLALDSVPTSGRSPWST